MPCTAIAVHSFNGCSRTWHQLFKSRIPSPQLLDATLTSYYIILHPPTSPRSMQYIYVRQTVQYSNLFSGSGWLWQFGRFTVESSAHWIPSTSKLSESDLKGHILHDWMITCFPISPCNTSKGTTTQPKKHRIWQYDSMPALDHSGTKPRSRKSSWSIESVRNGDCLGFSEESEAKFSRRNIDPMFWETHFPPDGMILWRRETFNSFFSPK